MNDVIGRQAAIDAIRKGYPDAINSDYKDGLRIGTDRAIYHVEQLPSAQPEPHWIPVTEDTPKEAGTYMCTCYDAGRRIVTLVKWQPRTKTWNLTGARAYWKVIAWCKRPEPYKGVTDGTD